MTLFLLAACVPREIALGGAAADHPDDTGAVVPEYPALCPSTAGPAGELARWTATGGAFSFVRMDGSVDAAWTFFADRVGGSGTVSVVADGERIVAVGLWYAADGADVVLATELVAFDRAGAVVWTHAEDDVYSSAAYVGADGTVAWDRGYRGFDASDAHLAGYVFADDGTRATLAGWPVGTPLDGAVPTCDGDGCAWSDASGAVLGEPRPQLDVWRATVGDRLLEPSLLGRTVGVLAAGRDENVFLPLEGSSRLDDVELLDVEGDHALIRGGERLWRFEASTATVTPVEAILPEGLRFFEAADYCEAMPPGLTATGDLLVALRDDAAGAVWHTDPAGSRWERIGAPVTDVVWLSGEAVGGTTVVNAVSWSDTYCPELPWSGGDAHRGSWTQLVRGDVVVPVDPSTLPGWGAVDISEDGACVVLPDGEAPAVLDIETGASTPLAGWGGWVLDR